MGEAGPGSGGGPSRRVVEALTAVITAVVVASGVVAVGVVTQDDQQNSADSGGPRSPSEQLDTPDESATPATTPGQADEPGQNGDRPTSGPDNPEVTRVDVAVDQADYTGRCPVTLEFSVGITTVNGPVQVDYEWLDGDSNVVATEQVRLDGPQEQSVRPRHPVEVTPSATETVTVQRTVEVATPNAESDTVEATVTCAPYAEITKAGEDEDPPLAAGCRLLHFDATITAPRDMSVTYVWQRLDGTPAPSGEQTVEFTGAGVQTQSIPRQSLPLGDETGEYGYRLHILEPYDVLSDPVTYQVNGCSEPAT